MSSLSRPSFFEKPGDAKMNDSMPEAIGKPRKRPKIDNSDIHYRPRSSQQPLSRIVPSPYSMDDSGIEHCTRFHDQPQGHPLQYRILSCSSEQPQRRLRTNDSDEQYRPRSRSSSICSKGLPKTTEEDNSSRTLSVGSDSSESESDCSSLCPNPCHWNDLPSSERCDDDCSEAASPENSLLPSSPLVPADDFDCFDSMYPGATMGDHYDSIPPSKRSQMEREPIYKSLFDSPFHTYNTHKFGGLDDIPEHTKLLHSRQREFSFPFLFRPESPELSLGGNRYQSPLHTSLFHTSLLHPGPYQAFPHGQTCTLPPIHAFFNNTPRETPMNDLGRQIQMQRIQNRLAQETLQQQILISRQQDVRQRDKRLFRTTITRKPKPPELPSGSNPDAMRTPLAQAKSASTSAPGEPSGFARQGELTSTIASEAIQAQSPPVKPTFSTDSPSDSISSVFPFPEVMRTRLTKPKTTAASAPDKIADVAVQTEFVQMPTVEPLWAPTSPQHIPSWSRTGISPSFIFSPSSPARSSRPTLSTLLAAATHHADLASTYLRRVHSAYAGMPRRHNNDGEMVLDTEAVHQTQYLILETLLDAATAAEIYMAREMEQVRTQLQHELSGLKKRRWVEE